MKLRLLPLTVLIYLLAVSSFAQVPAEDQAEKQARIHTEAIAFLRETMAEASNMRSMENRISFTADLASLMWYHDEREARNMFVGAISDFRSLLAGYDNRMNSFGVESGDSHDGGGGPFAIGEQSEKMMTMRKFRVAMGVRQQIAMSVAEHDPEMAFSFLAETMGALTNPQFREQMETSGQYFEQQLLIQIAERNPGQAGDLAAPSLSDGVNYLHVELLKKIYAKNADAGVKFGAKVLSSFKSAGPDKAEDFVMLALLSFGKQTLEASRKEGGKKPVFTDGELREIADVGSQNVVRAGEEYDSGHALNVASAIESILPARAAQIRAKYKPPTLSSGSGVANALSNVTTTSGSGSATAIDTEAEARRKAEEKVTADLLSLAKRELPDEERQRVVARARQFLMSESSREKKIAGLNMLAAQVAKAGDIELAREIMRDVEGLINPYPKNYQDFLYTWMVISGYAEADPDRAFVMLEGSVYRANELISAFVKVAEFIDVAEEIIVDGEVQVGAFGGSMVRGLSKELGVAESTIATLVKADFAKTRAITSRFDRLEVRVLAKMLVLRSILDKGPTKGTDEELIKSVTKGI